jgi:site-specific DNA-methyltransferase (adenine-specific)
VQELLEQAGFIILNRITWKRDKGRGAGNNWKSMHEDIWFVSKTRHYTFNIEDVKIEKPVVAPYRNIDGTPKDWFITPKGIKLRMTYPGNLWTEYTVPFWSMKEVRSYAKTKRTPDNTLTKHNAQKPKELVRRCLMASSNPGDLVADYFVGAGTTAIVAAELGRRVVALDINKLCINMLEERIKNELTIDKN